MTTTQQMEIQASHLLKCERVSTLGRVQRWVLYIGKGMENRDGMVYYPGFRTEKTGQSLS